MGERATQVILVVLAILVGFTILGWLLKALWWVTVVAAGIVIGGVLLGRIAK